MRHQLDLSPITKGYDWLTKHPNNFSMSYFAANRVLNSPNEDMYESLSFVNLGSPIPEYTTFCLGGAILLVDALERGLPEVNIYEPFESILDRTISFLKKANPSFSGNSDEWWEFENDFSRIVYGSWFNLEYNVRISDVTLGQLAKSIEFLQERWGKEAK
jgi:hypothetical protein